MAQHHFMVFPAYARLLVAPERRTCRVCVILVYPNTARLNGSRYLVKFVRIAGPNAGTKAI
ncbi:hypothetical protein D3C85_1554470 [compost metagenome]